VLHPRHRALSQAHAAESDASASTLPTPPQDSRPGPSVQEMEDHLNGLFQPLVFPPEMAARILTHASHPDALVRHNARLSFIGRRVLQTYLHLFLASAPALQSSPAGVHDIELITERALNTYVLGEHVAPRWGLGRVLKWTPRNVHLLGMDIEDDDPRELLKLPKEKGWSVGMYKVQGKAVEAVVGGVFHQFGGAVSHRLFHTRMLPHILLPGRPEGLHDAFHDHALEMCEQMGGLDAPLVKSS